jgi:hypothetical protein
VLLVANATGTNFAAETAPVLLILTGVDELVALTDAVGLDEAALVPVVPAVSVVAFVADRAVVPSELLVDFSGEVTLLTGVVAVVEAVLELVEGGCPTPRSLPTEDNKSAEVVIGADCNV